MLDIRKVLLNEHGKVGDQAKLLVVSNMYIRMLIANGVKTGSVKMVLKREMKRLEEAGRGKGRGVPAAFSGSARNRSARHLQNIYHHIQPLQSSIDL